METRTYVATFETGWRATVRDASAAAARRRFTQTGRGEPFNMRAAGHAALLVWGRDADDDYSDDEVQ